MSVMSSGSESGSPSEARPGPMTAEYPLSPLQLGMLFHWLLDAGSGIDIEQIVADLEEGIDPVRLAQAWQSALETFGTLRTAFRWEGLATPLQRVQTNAVLRFAFEDLRQSAPSEQEQRISEFLRSDRREGFDLTRAPAMRVSLFQLGDAQFRMIWSFHHILIDGRSFETILAHVFATYAGERTSDYADVPYRDYIDWVDRQEPEVARAFWRNKLEGFVAPTSIPNDHPVGVKSDRFGECATALPRQVSQRLRDVAKREDLSLNTILMGAWAFLLSRYTAETDVVFGVTKTTRRGTIPTAPSMIGLFLATIPVRIAVDHDLPVVDWLRTVRREWVSLRGSEHLPLVEIRQASHVPSATPLFESLVVYEEHQFGTRLAARGGAWSTRRFRIIEETGFPLNLLAYGDDALVVKLEYDARRFNADTIGRMLGHLASVLTCWADDVGSPLWATPMLGPAERQLILEGWNDTSREYPRDTPLAVLVESQVARTPDAMAVTFESQSITYADLNERANGMARELRRLGARADVLVGLALERSIEMMVALLAVIKTGACYVPLDPMFPSERLEYMIQDSGLGLLIVQSSTRSTFPNFRGTLLDVDHPTWESKGSANLGTAGVPEDLAVVIYTSGSTGRPKGVQISRGALINLLWSMREWLELKSSDRLLAVTTISFDIAGADIWLPWLVGAHTIVASREAAADGEQLEKLLTAHDITFLQATPITWRQLLGVGWAGKYDLQAVCTGEAMPPEVATALVPLVKRLWNLYGPTETTIWSTGVEVRNTAEKIMIGRPIANTQCFILDDHRQPVPIGVTGELYIAGDGLARGYLNRPELDDERFLSNPFSKNPLARMYRTGDLARFLLDGTIECLGRTDHQVKIRGFRIELGEIENALREHPSVKQCVVIAREDTPGDKRLVAYVVPEDGSVDATKLRTHLKQTLPEYMLPAAIVSMEAVPLTANGKIDRRALRAPDATISTSDAATVTARSHVEKQLSEIWEDLFKI